MPSLLAPLAGVVIDRFRRRTVMIVTDIATAAVVLLLLLVDGREDLWLLYVVAFLYGASLVAFSSARSALLPAMVDDEMLGQANGSLGTGREALRLVAPLAGAALYAGFGGPAVAILDAATFLVSAAALLALRVDEPAPEPHGGRFTVEAAAGGRHLLGDPVLRTTVVATVICMLALGISESAYFAIVDDGLGQPVEFVGVLSAVQGVGAILAGRRHHRDHPAHRRAASDGVGLRVTRRRGRPDDDRPARPGGGRGAALRRRPAGPHRLHDDCDPSPDPDRAAGPGVHGVRALRRRPAAAVDPRRRGGGDPRRLPHPARGDGPRPGRRRASTRGSSCARNRSRRAAASQSSRTRPAVDVHVPIGADVVQQAPVVGHEQDGPVVRR